MNSFQFFSAVSSWFLVLCWSSASPIYCACWKLLRQAIGMKKEEIYKTILLAIQFVHNVLVLCFFNVLMALMQFIHFLYPFAIQRAPWLSCISFIHSNRKHVFLYIAFCIIAGSTVKAFTCTICSTSSWSGIPGRNKLCIDVFFVRMHMFSTRIMLTCCFWLHDVCERSFFAFAGILNK